jgi:HD-like signal output (HDOD) protein
MSTLKSIDRRLLGRLPAFSPIAVRLLSLLSQENVSLKEVERLIMLDPVLAGEVLRLANSGLYGRRMGVRSILFAIAVLGCGKLSQIAVTAALWRGLPRRTAPFVRDWWRHSIASAFIARQHSIEESMDIAYTAALLHGVGQLAMLEDAPIEYPTLVESAYEGEADLLDKERAMFGIDHASLAGMILDSWELPEKLCDVVTQHHDPSSSTRLLAALQTGCVGAEYAGFGRCGCHKAIESGSHEKLAERFTNGYLDLLVATVNGIECSLV